MMADNDILLGGTGTNQVTLNAGMANRHGLITGATGTGKTVTLQVLAESFSRLGVPVFTADAKGDLSGLAGAGKPHPKIDERLQFIGIEDHAFEASPTLLWDVYGDKGHPVRTTVSEMGPTLLSNLLELNETQQGVMQIAFSVADDEGLLLLDMDDLRSMLHHVSKHSSEYSSRPLPHSGTGSQALAPHTASSQVSRPQQYRFAGLPPVRPGQSPQP